MTTEPTADPRPKRSRMSRIQRREQLIGIGRHLFAAHGFDAVSVEEIATAAGVSKPVIYEHFGGKQMAADADQLFAPLNTRHP